MEEDKVHIAVVWDSNPRIAGIVSEVTDPLFGLMGHKRLPFDCDLSFHNADSSPERIVEVLRDKIEAKIPIVMVNIRPDDFHSISYSMLPCDYPCKMVGVFAHSTPSEVVSYVQDAIDKLLFPEDSDTEEPTNTLYNEELAPIFDRAEEYPDLNGLIKLKAKEELFPRIIEEFVKQRKNSPLLIIDDSGSGAAWYFGDKKSRKKIVQISEKYGRPNQASVKDMPDFGIIKTGSQMSVSNLENAVYNYHLLTPNTPKEIQELCGDGVPFFDPEKAIDFGNDPVPPDTWVREGDYWQFRISPSNKRGFKCKPIGNVNLGLGCFIDNRLRDEMNELAEMSASQELGNFQFICQVTKRSGQTLFLKPIEKFQNDKRTHWKFKKTGNDLGKHHEFEALAYTGLLPKNCTAIGLRFQRFSGRNLPDYVLSYLKKKNTKFKAAEERRDAWMERVGLEESYCPSCSRSGDMLVVKDFHAFMDFLNTNGFDFEVTEEVVELGDSIQVQDPGAFSIVWEDKGGKHVALVYVKALLDSGAVPVGLVGELELKMGERISYVYANIEFLGFGVKRVEVASMMFGHFSPTRNCPVWLMAKVSDMVLANGHSFHEGDDPVFARMLQLAPDEELMMNLDEAIERAKYEAAKEHLPEKVRSAILLRLERSVEHLEFALNRLATVAANFSSVETDMFNKHLLSWLVSKMGDKRARSIIGEDRLGGLEAEYLDSDIFERYVSQPLERSSTAALYEEFAKSTLPVIEESVAAAKDWIRFYEGYANGGIDVGGADTNGDGGTAIANDVYSDTPDDDSR